MNGILKVLLASNLINNNIFPTKAYMQCLSQFGDFDALLQYMYFLYSSPLPQGQDHRFQKVPGTGQISGCEDDFARFDHVHESFSSKVVQYLPVENSCPSAVEVNETSATHH